jgi:hypothetical protein
MTLKATNVNELQDMFARMLARRKAAQNFVQVARKLVH